jgi:exodeoxyribonuclease V alpha subunit
MEVPCIVERVTYRSDKFAILACNLDPYSDKYSKGLYTLVKPFIHKKWRSFTVVVDTLEEGENPEGRSYVCVGEFVHDTKRGSQFKASGYYQDVPTNLKTMKLFLKQLPNIKESRANEILSRFTIEEVIDVLDNEPKKLLEISGISEKRLVAIIRDWKKISHKRELYKWFVECDIPIKLADKAYEIWRNETKAKLIENPYRLTKLRGHSFVSADIIAHRINDKVDDTFRVTACIEYCLNEDSRSNGNLCMPYVLLKKTVVQKLAECNIALKKPVNSDYEKMVPYVVRDKTSPFTAVKDTIENISYVYITVIWEREKFIAETLYKRSKRKSNWSFNESDMGEAEANISFFLGKEIKLDETQKEAIKSAFNNRITIITGGGGTGKSTICRCIFSIARKKNLAVNMMSPTGKAAKVLSKRTGGTATTIHRGLGIGPDSVLPEESITQEILLVDEISMSGIDTMYALMVAVESNPNTNIVFVGDKNQLPSVSPGNFLADLMKTDCANVVTLDKVHRQDEDSYISLIANDISKGKATKIPDTARDITWCELNPHTIEKEIADLVEDYFNEEEDIEDLQILSPMKKGGCGVNRLNEVIQERMAVLNECKTRVLEREFKKFYVGDKVIQTKNNYTKDVFNGDMGIIVDLGERISDPSSSDKKEKYICVDFGDKKVYYYKEEIEQVMVAWVITVHKFQGSQSKDIVMIMSSEASIMMNKELVYTAFTRAEKNLYIYGSERMYNLAPTKSSIKRRFTNLNNIIKELTSGNKFLQVV